MDKTSISVSKRNRDHLAQIAHDELGDASMDDTLTVVLFERESNRQMAALAADPDGLADYQREMRDISEGLGQVVDG